MINFSKFEYRKEVIPTDPEAKQQFLDALQEKFIAEIKASDIYQDYLQKYEPSSVETFVTEHAKLKASFIKNIDYYLHEYNQNKEEGYLENAREVIGHILQKKLFNLQLQWRAEKINIEEISNSFEFSFWEKHISFCPFIPPVTQHEIDLAKQFLQKFGFSNLDEFYEFQDYDEITRKNENDEFENMPDWYEFYDGMMGTGILLQLPNIRGAKEEQYMDIAREAEKQKMENSNTVNTAPTTTYVPTIFHYGREVRNFVDVYEKDPCFKAFFQIWFRVLEPEFPDPEYNQSQTEWAIKILEEADRPLMIEGGLIWHKALIQCAEKYITEHIIDALDTAYEEYQTCLDLGIAKRFTPEELKEEMQRSYVHLYTEMILKGRQLSGESDR